MIFVKLGVFAGVACVKRAEAIQVCTGWRFGSFFENPIPRDVAEKFVILINEYDGWKVMNLDGRTVLKAIEIEKEHETPYWDSQIAAVMEENGIKKIFTENEEDFEGIPWIEVENPLEG